jgi:transposase InsO family protein
LSPLPIPEGAWQVVSLDFIESLPKSGNANCILVIVDKFSKYGHFVTLTHPFAAEVVAQAFLNQIYRLHGMPMTIISDRDRIFTNKFWHELFKLAKVTLQMSSAYHPQSDGQTEQVNQCFETFLCCFVHACPKQWLKWLGLVEYWYNTSYHTSLGYSPFQVLYGHLHRHFGLQPDDACQLSSLDDWLQE